MVWWGTYNRGLAVGTVVGLRIGCVRYVTSVVHSICVCMSLPESQPDLFGETVERI